jgi:hypothetical protein
MKRSIILILVVAAAFLFFHHRADPDVVYVRADGTVRLGDRVVSTDDVMAYAFANRQTPLEVRLCKGAHPMRTMPFTSALQAVQIKVDVQRTRSGCGS